MDCFGKRYCTRVLFIVLLEVIGNFKGSHVTDFTPCNGQHMPALRQPGMQGAFIIKR